ncbi:hypothetical protein FOPE_03097 [Fonsecaea pedrosoi]|nr:hypothetical protein FOPE_03097 [Fonsecaea pedrosoi]
MNEPAMISFFSVTGVILLVAAIAIWRTHHKSHMRGQVDDTAIHNDDGGNSRNGHQDADSIRAGNAPVIDGQADNRGGNWRWRKIIDGVGWAQVPNGPEDREETRVMARRRGITEKPEQALVSVSIGSAEAQAGTSYANDVEKGGSRPTDVMSFENLGGYRYGDFAYGHDNMAPLPVPASGPDQNSLYRHSPGIAEVEAVPAGSYLSRIPSTDSRESGHGCRLTSYNGLPPVHQQQHDDMMAALPISKDHPLYQHHPVSQSPAPSQPSDQSSDHKPPAFHYERGSLVPAPLNPRRGKRCLDVDQNHEPTPTAEPVRAASGLTLERPSSARSQPASASGSGSREWPEPRYSMFESPLRQHPPELFLDLPGPRDVSAQTSTQEPQEMLAAETGTKDGDDLRTDCSLTTEMKSSSPKLHQPVNGFNQQRHHHHPRQGQGQGHRHRHFSSCDAGWTTVPLTPSSQSSAASRPSRWSWTAEDFRVVGTDGDNVV